MKWVHGSRWVVLIMFACEGLALAGGIERKYWVFFTDKGPSRNLSAQYAECPVTARALHRRAKVLPPEHLLGPGDLPLYEPYLRAVAGTGARPVHNVRWLNAISVLADSAQHRMIERLPFVATMETVVVLRSSRPLPPANTAPSPRTTRKELVDYGPSYDQLEMINIPQLHDLGFRGRGILIGILDSGFRWKTHEALSGRRVLAEHDFIFNDDITANQQRDRSDQDLHGTIVFSVLGGYAPGKLIGPAYDADFILAKTEYVPSEFRIEEDHWAAAMEWMENQGVDLVSSSVGYNVFDDGTGYYWVNGDFNGRTSITARAAVQAARLGVFVCTAMGNEFQGDGVTGTLLTPADADSILSVGAVTLGGSLAAFSSTGPTNDGRTKPDVVAPGAYIYGATTAGPASYNRSEGTSLSTPLAAGAAALLLSAKPGLTPVALRDLLRSTADTTNLTMFAGWPNNFMGWGLINPLKALLELGTVFNNEPTVIVAGSSTIVSTTVISRFGIRPGTVFFRYLIGGDTTVHILPMALDSSFLFGTSGRYRVSIPPLVMGTPVRFFCEAVDSSNNRSLTPPMAPDSLWSIRYGVPGIYTRPDIPADYVLPQNYPNPFNGITKITFDLPRDEFVTVRIYNVLGELIATLLDGPQVNGFASSRPPLVFHAGNLPSGVYFYRLSTPSFSATRKMMLLR